MSKHSRLQVLDPKFMSDCECGNDHCKNGPEAVRFTHMQRVDQILQKTAEFDAKTHASNGNVVLMEWVCKRMEEIKGLLVSGVVTDKELLVAKVIQMIKRDYPVDSDTQNYLFKLTMGVLFKDEFEDLKHQLEQSEERAESVAHLETWKTRQAVDALEEVASLMSKKRIGEGSPVAVSVKRQCTHAKEADDEIVKMVLQETEFGDYEFENMDAFKKKMSTLNGKQRELAFRLFRTTYDAMAQEHQKPLLPADFFFKF
jgi:hypothetical protein